MKGIFTISLKKFSEARFVNGINGNLISADVLCCNTVQLLVFKLLVIIFSLSFKGICFLGRDCVFLLQVYCRKNINNNLAISFSIVPALLFADDV